MPQARLWGFERGACRVDVPNTGHGRRRDRFAAANKTDGVLRHGKGFFLILPIHDDLWQSRDADWKAAFLFRLKGRLRACVFGQPAPTQRARNWETSVERMRAHDNSLLSPALEGGAPVGLAHSSAQASPAAGSVAVSVDRLTKAFRGKPAVSDISFSARQNQFVSIVGRSGCGKSTMLKMIAGLIEPTSGSVMVNGAKVEAPLRNASMVFQAPVLMPWRRVLGNVLFCIELRGELPAKNRRQALALIKLAGLSGFENHYPHQLSGGMQQRVAICRARRSSPKPPPDG